MEVRTVRFKVQKEHRLIHRGYVSDSTGVILFSHDGVVLLHQTCNLQVQASLYVLKNLNRKPEGQVPQVVSSPPGFDFQFIATSRTTLS